MTKRNHTRVLLLNPPMPIEQLYGSFAAFGSISAPTGLCYIAAKLRSEGNAVSIVDAEALQLDIQSTVDRIMEYNPDIVGMSCKTAWIVNAHKVAGELKKRSPDLPIVAGGHHVTILPERTLKEFPFFDYLVLGEGEITLSELIHALESHRDLRDVPGLAFRANGASVITGRRERIKDLDSLPPPAYDLLPKLESHYWPIFNNIEKLPAFSLIFSRGCSGKCSFCDRGMFGNRITRHSPEYCLALIEKLRSEYGIRYFVFDDDNFLLNKKYLLEFLELMNERRIKIPFSCESRVDSIDEERLIYLKKAGCRQIMFGIESGSQKMLERMKKGITIDQIRAAVRMTQKHKIKTLGYFMLGYPGETEETMMETVALIKELNLFDVSVQTFTPLPGAEIYSQVCDLGNYVENWEKSGSLEEIVFVPDGLSQDMINDYVNKAYDACYNRAFQWVMAPKRFYTMKHFKAIMKFYFGR